jgi:hypothetical protein
MLSYKTDIDESGRTWINFFFSVYKNKTTLPPPRWRTWTHFDMIAWGEMDSHVIFGGNRPLLCWASLNDRSQHSHYLSWRPAEQTNPTQRYQAIYPALLSDYCWMPHPSNKIKNPVNRAKSFLNRKRIDITNSIRKKRRDIVELIRQLQRASFFLSWSTFHSLHLEKKKQENSICDILQCGRRRWQSEIHDRGVAAFKRKKNK